jgi:hypothetical protein
MNHKSQIDIFTNNLKDIFASYMNEHHDLKVNNIKLVKENEMLIKKNETLTKKNEMLTKKNEILTKKYSKIMKKNDKLSKSIRSNEQEYNEILEKLNELV